MRCSSLFVTSAARANGAVAADIAVPVTVDNFVRAESDLYLSAVALKEGGFGKFEHHRELSPIDAQTVIRHEPRHALFRGGVRSRRGPVTITLPDAGKRFMSMQVINQDQYSPPALYGAEPHTLTRRRSARATCWSAIRTLVDPADPADMKQVHALQDAIKVEQQGAGQVRGAELGPGEPEEGARRADRARHAR